MSWVFEFEDKELAKHVKAGCRLLDKHKRGWWHKVNTKKLDAQDPKNCILAQVFGNFEQGCRIIGADCFYPFGCSGAEHNPHWRKEIRRRRARARRNKKARWDMRIIAAGMKSLRKV